MKTKILPLPECIAPDIDWTITHDSRKAYCDFTHGKLVVPLDGAIGSYATRCHELGHIRYSPRDWTVRLESAKVSERSFQAIEDYRVNYLVQHDSKVSMGNGYGREYITRVCNSCMNVNDEKNMVLSAIAFGAIDCDSQITREVMKDKLTRRLKGIISYVMRQLRNKPTIETSFDMAHYVDEQFKPEPSDSSEPEPNPDESDAPADNESNVIPPTTPLGGMPIDDDDTDDESEEYENDSSGHDVRKPTDEIIADYVEDKSDGIKIPSTHSKLQAVANNDSGRMQIKTPDLPRIVEQHGTKKFVSVKEGSLFYRPFMLTVNRKVFRGVSRHAPCAVLIDNSGSMNLSVKSIERIIHALPASIVGIYEGVSDYGFLTIVARNGRMASADDMKGQFGGNVIDVPALEWLAKQKGRKIWVCDGGVTGIGDDCTPAINARCNEIKSRAKIEQIYSVKNLLRDLNTK